MAETAWTELIGRIHDSEHQLVIAVTGGGSKAISQLLDVSGASRTVLEAVVPYASSSFEQWLGGVPDQYCSEPTARAMAMAAWMRARELAPEADVGQLVGVGATASLATDRPKRGDHRVHVAVQTSTHTASCSWKLSKGSRDRKKEQWLAAKLILLAIGEACELDTAAACESLDSQRLETEYLDPHTQAAEAVWTEVLMGKQKSFIATGARNDLAKVVFPGAFNPPHAGHQRMAEIAAAKLGEPVAFELSITNVDKPPLDFVRIRKRIEGFQQWDDSAKLILTDAPTFVEKAGLFPGCTFVVGADTIERIGQPKYYDNSHIARDTAIEAIAKQGCRFLVFGRHREGEFRSIDDLGLPDELAAICEEVSEAEFCEEISSTQLRREMVGD